MAKSKHTITDIQKALLSNTKYIKEAEQSPQVSDEPKEPEVAPVIQANQVNIEPLTLKKIKILAAYLGEPVDELINKSLNHFLRLKALQLEQAIQKLTEEE
jgi:hypothetical protein